MNRLNQFLTVGATVGLICVASESQARNEVIKLNIAEALETADAKAKLKPEITFHFGSANAPAAAKNLGATQSNKKTNGFKKDKKSACQHAFLSAMLSFQERAIKEGGDAVVKITSYYYKNAFDSTTEFECGTGNVMVGVTFQGEVIKKK